MPFFSVIVPVYNAEGYLERCIESIKKQDFRDYEVIFIDDASQDSSPEICREVCNTDKRFRYYLKSHRGAAASRNYGMRRSVGNYIVFVDADDYIAAQFLQYLFKTLVSGEEADLCYFNSHFVACENNIIKNRIFEVTENYVKEKTFSRKEFLALVSLKGNYMTGSTWLMVFKRDFVLKNHLEFDEKLVWSEDSDLSYSAVIRADKIKCCTYCGYYYYIGNGKSVSKGITLDKAMGRMDVYSKWSLYFLNNADAKREYSNTTRENLVQQFLCEYCGILNTWWKNEDKDERKRMYERLKRERYLWRRCEDHKYKDYIRFGIRGGGMVQEVKRIIKNIIMGK